MKKRYPVISFLLCVLLISTLLAGCQNSAATGGAKNEAETSSAAEADLSVSKQVTEDASLAQNNENSAESLTDADSSVESDVPDDSTFEPESVTQETADDDNYTLKRVLVLSRHNIRSPMSGEGSLLGTATPHEWFHWTSDTSQLSLRGGILETIMGQYFRKWLESENLIPENYQPENGEVRFYANAKQRTQATARYFASGMLPVADIEVERKSDFDTMDEVFTPKIHFLNEKFQTEAMEQIAAMGGEAGMNGLDTKLEKTYELLSDVIDLEDSEAYKNGEFTGFTPGDTEVTLTVDEEPSMAGSLKSATQFSDALILQYYEEPDVQKAAFGHELSMEDWEALAEIKDVYQDTLFSAPLVAINVAQPLLSEMKTELESDEHLFTFLCGHDSNIGSVLAAMGAYDYSLPDTIEKKTPIGGKLVFEQYESPDGKMFCKINLVYQTTEQIRNIQSLTLENPPAIFEMEFEGLEKNADGYYPLEDITGRIQDTLDVYDSYAAEDEALAPVA